jgi:large subunit ribosomal protein L29
MKIGEIRGKTDEELVFELGKIERELFDRRFKAAAETSADPSRIRRMRRSIARIHTILHERKQHVRGQEPR